MVINMFRPNYWHHKNIKFSNTETTKVINDIKKVGKELIIRDEKLISTFFFKNHCRPDKIWISKYDEIMADIVKEAGMFTSCQYMWLFWSQLYFQNAFHGVHNHVGHEESISHIKGYKDFISWVHFIKTPKQKCFRFTDKNGKYFYPEEQNDGDLIVFPSYIWHEVLPLQTNEERFVTAGNIAFTHIDES